VKIPFAMLLGNGDGVTLFLSVMKIALLYIFMSIPVLCAAQTGNFWNTLAQVHFENKQDKNGYTVEVPVFSTYLKTFQGKRITLKGYVIPLEEVGGSGKFMLSSLPFNLCYFCGAAGPETAMEVETKEKVKFSTRSIMMEGTLMLNDRDPNHHIYILKEARLVPN